ncbi:MAG: type 1 glutamine amidotransferase [Bdellovibrionaceae bacterium]|nr:type 1 glutamine amidotransferase [Pseudobdellovibrionaceae bacterium]
MRALIVRQSDGTPPGTTNSILQNLGWSIDEIFVYRGEPLPKPGEHRLVVLCGGGPNVDEVDKYPWLIQEKEFIGQILKLPEVKIIGLCLGAQLIAEALGARVSRHHDWEVGWYDVWIQPDGKWIKEEKILKVFQYHQYSFDTPNGAVRIATNHFCEHQGFVWQDRVIAFQFHPETSIEWSDECAEDRDFPSTGKLQNSGVIKELGRKHQPTLQQWYAEVLSTAPVQL